MEAIDKLRELSKKLDDPYFIKEFEEGFEKFLKERDMKIYHTRTLEDYDALMIELEEKGCTWLDDTNPTELNWWETYQENTYVKERDGKLTYGNVNIDRSYPENYSEPPLIEYKARGDKQMLNTECKQCHKKWHHDNAKYCSMCGNKLVDEPEFKKGDIVASTAFGYGSFSFVRLNEDLTNLYNSVDGLWYVKRERMVLNGSIGVFKGDVRKATPEEITEYELALTFHDHGRKPFEVKEGDLIKTSSGRNIIACYPENYSRVSFLKDGWEFLKTAEEVNEWIRGE